MTSHKSSLSRLLLLTVAIPIEARLEGVSNRSLQTDDGAATATATATSSVTKYAPSSWEDCLGMSPSKCKQHILDSVGGNLDNHVIPNLNLVVSPVRSPEIKEETYWEVGIPTTVDGLVDCSLGDVRFPYEWVTSSRRYSKLGPWDCNGLDVSMCCEKILQYMDDRNISRTDRNGNCLSCRAHQEPLEPHIDVDNVEGYFLEHYWDTTKNSCDIKAYTHADIRNIDSSVAADFIGTRAQIESVLHSASPILCSDYIALHHTLLKDSRSLPHVMSNVVGMLCGTCDTLSSSDTDVLAPDGDGLDQSIKDNLSWIWNELSSATIRSDYAEIIIYTNYDNSRVRKIPVLGGSRTGTVSDDGFLVPEEIIVPECPAATLQDLQKYWDWRVITTDTAKDDTCACPDHPGLLEFNHICFCQGGFKLWDNESQSCRCPYGHKEGTTECLCPGPYTDLDLDWNKVGWIDNGSGSCKVDKECTQSELDYYLNFRRGCDQCNLPHINVNGKCELDCEHGLIYNKDLDECVCEHHPDMIYRGNKCECKIYDSVWTGTKCECPPEMPLINGNYCDFDF